MGAIEEIKALLRRTLYSRYGDGYPDRVDKILDTMLRELQVRSGLERSKLESSITRYELISRNDHSKEGGESATRVTYMAASDHGDHSGPFDWIPHSCHITIDLCWPIPDDEGLIHCLRAELPWPCPDTGPITIPPIEM